MESSSLPGYIQCSKVHSMILVESMSHPDSLSDMDRHIVFQSIYCLHIAFLAIPSMKPRTDQRGIIVWPRSPFPAAYPLNYHSESLGARRAPRRRRTSRPRRSGSFLAASSRSRGKAPWCAAPRRTGSQASLRQASPFGRPTALVARRRVRRLREELGGEETQGR
jgi:hypothetical protein